MAALPYMQLYVAEYLADTTHLNAAQHGAYLLLLMNYWQRGKALPNNDDRLAITARMTPQEWKKNREAIAEFFEITETEWMHWRVDRDLKAVSEKSETNKANGRLGGRPRKPNGYPEKTDDKPNGFENESETKGNRTDKNGFPPTPPKGGRRFNKAAIGLARPIELHPYEEDLSLPGYCKHCGFSKHHESHSEAA